MDARASEFQLFGKLGVRTVRLKSPGDGRASVEAITLVKSVPAQPPG